MGSKLERTGRTPSAEAGTIARTPPKSMFLAVLRAVLVAGPDAVGVGSAALREGGRPGADPTQSRPRRGAGVVDRGGLETRCALYWVPRVRIPPSPPALTFVCIHQRSPLSQWCRFTAPFLAAVVRHNPCTSVGTLVGRRPPWHG